MPLRAEMQIFFGQVVNVKYDFAAEVQSHSWHEAF